MAKTKGGVDLEANERSLTLVSWRDGTKRTIPFDDQEQLISLIRRAGHPPDGVLVIDEDGPLPLDERLDGTYVGRTLKVIRVASGG